MGGLETFGLTLEEVLSLPRGKRRSIAGYCLRYGFYSDARDILKHVAAEDSEGMLYRMWLVQALVNCGEAEEAEPISEKLAADFPEHAGVLSARAQVLMSLDRHDEAREIYTRFSAQPEKGYNYWANTAAAAQRKGDWRAASEALKKALEIVRERQVADPGSYATPVYLWLAIIRQGEHDGEDVNGFVTELESLRADEEGKILDALAKQDRSRPGARSKQPPIAPRPPSSEPAEPIVIPESAPNPHLQSKLREYFGFEDFRPGQQQVIETILDGGSVLAVMPTGGGKSLCYQLPSMLLDGVTLVVSPLIALMKDQVDGLPAQVQEQVTLVNSTLEGDEIERRLRDIRAGKYKLVYAAPERLRQRPFLHALKRRGVSLVVVDEAHCVSMWGHDFRPDYLFIGNALEYLDHPPVLAMTATATPKMRLEISNSLGRQVRVISTGTHRPNLFLESVMVRSDEEKMRELIRLCTGIEGSGIVYTRSREKTELLARLLRRERVKATFYHAGMEPDERTRTQEEFMDGRWRVICATVAFGMGIDKSDVRFVIHYSLPSSLEDYYQEAGRAGRDGEISRCILLSTPSDKALVTTWMRRERMGIELPRDCYRYLREITRNGPFAAVSIDDFQRELNQEETRVRVAISMLENVGLAKRHLDVPASANIGLTPKGAAADDAEFARFVENARLRVNQRIPLQTLDLCERASVRPDEIEEKLLDWRDKGYLMYSGSGRVMLLERPNAPTDSKKALEDLLSRFASMQDERVGTVFYYAETRHCKHSTIAAHFGEPDIEGCSSCDSCAPRRKPGTGISKVAKSTGEKLTNDERRLKILETVRKIPGEVGFTGLVRVLKGSVASHIKRDRCPTFGVLANDPKAIIEQCVRDLIEDEYLRRDDGEYRLISLGRKGLEELKG